MHRRTILGAPLLALGAAAPARAQAFPARPVRVIIPFPPGGGIDIFVRAMAADLQQRWGQPVIVENRAGGSGAVGAEAAARAPADGHTLFASVNQVFTTNRYMIRSLPYDPDTSFVPISLMAQSDHMLLAHPSLAADDVPGLVALARRERGRLNYGSFGIGSQPQLVFEALNQREGLDLQHIPYPGVAPMMLALTRGEVALATGSGAVAGELIRAGRIKALANAGSRRIAQFPEVPTTAEQGFPYLQASIWYGLFAPAGTPAAALERIGADVRAVISAPAFAEAQITSRGLDLVASTPQALAGVIREEAAAAGAVLRAARIEPQ